MILIQPIYRSKDIRRLDTFVQYGVSAGIQAIEDAGLDNNVDKDRVGLNIGSGIGAWIA